MWMRSDCRSILPSRSRIGDAVRLDRERRVLDGDGAVGVRVGGRAGDSIVASNVPVTSVSAVVKPWTMPTSIGVLSTRKSIGSLEVHPCPSSNSAVGDLAPGLDPRRRILLQLRVDGDAGAGVVDRAAERVVAELAEAALLDRECRPRLRRVGRPGHRAAGVEAAGELRRPEQQRVDPGDVDVARRHLQRVARAARTCRPRDPLIAVGQREVA